MRLAHPSKSESTGEIVGVEPGEATWMVEVLAGLFDFCLVAPNRAIERREALNQKLLDMGRRPRKSVPIILFPKQPTGS